MCCKLGWKCFKVISLNLIEVTDLEESYTYLTILGSLKYETWLLIMAYISTFILSMFAESVIPLILGMLDTNIGQDTLVFQRSFSWSSSVSPGEGLDSTLN